MTDSSELLRRLAAERGRLLAELGVRADDTRWTRLEAEAIAGLVTPELSVRMPRGLRQALRRFRKVIRR